MEFISYAPAVIAGQAAPSSVSHTVETDLLIVNSGGFAEKSQLSLYIDQVLGSATKVSYGLYWSFDRGATWYKLSVEDLVTNKGDLVDIPPYVDTNSPLQASTHLKTIFNCPMPGANAFKVTGLAAGADSGALILTAVVRDN